MTYALVTGASKGIGKAIAERLAERGFGLLLVARSGELLQQQADLLEKKYGIKAHSLALDLSNSGSAEKMAGWVSGLDVPLGVLVNNAGYGIWGSFGELSLDRQLHMLQINIATLFEATHRLIPLLKKNAPAYILNVGSMAGLQAMPSVAAYAASKAFVNTLSRGLSHELRPAGISVTVLIPGSVDTNFVEVSGMQHMAQKAGRNSMTAEQVATAAVDALFKKKIAVIPGFSNRLMAFAMKHLPRVWVEQVIAKLYSKQEQSGSLPPAKG
jgi:short-subunit dehydrogenase